MSYSRNKSLEEYGDLNSEHHMDRQAAREAGERALELENQPAFLVAELKLGGSYVINWSKGSEEVPVECRGLFTGTSQAKQAISLCMKRLTEEAAAQSEMEENASAEAEASRQTRGVTKEEDEAYLAEEVEAPVEKEVVKKKVYKKSA